MSINAANPEVYKRIRSAAAKIAAGVRRSNPTLELEGRQLFAAAHLENAILLYRSDLTTEAVANLGHLLFASESLTPELDILAKVEVPADVVKTPAIEDEFEDEPEA